METRPQSTQDVENSILFLATAFANKLTMGSSRRLKARFGIGLMEWRVIVMLATYPGCSAQWIADVSGVDKSVASRAVTELSGRGLVSISTDGQPGRTTALTLTASGRQIYDVGAPRADKSQALLLSGFSDPERAQMVDFFKRLMANLPLLDETA